MNPIPDQYKDLTSILAGAIFISFSSSWVAWSQVDPVVSAFYRVFFGSMILGLACLIKKEVHKISAKALLFCALCGLCFAGDLYCWHISIAYVGPGLATILGNFQVFVLTIISLLFFGQPVRFLFFVSLACAFLGLFLIVGINWGVLSDQYRIGVYFGLITALFYAVFILSLRQIQQINRDISFTYLLLLVSVTSTIVLGPLVPAAGETFAIPSLTSLAALLCLALFSQAIGWACIARSLPRVIPSLAGLVLLLQPSLAFIWDVLFFDRPTSAVQWLGVLIVLAAIYLGMGMTKQPAR